MKINWERERKTTKNKTKCSIFHLFDCQRRWVWHFKVCSCCCWADTYPFWWFSSFLFAVVCQSGNKSVVLPVLVLLLQLNAMLFARLQQPHATGSHLFAAEMFVKCCSVFWVLKKCPFWVKAAARLRIANKLLLLLSAVMSTAVDAFYLSAANPPKYCRCVSDGLASVLDCSAGRRHQWLNEHTAYTSVYTAAGRWWSPSRTVDGSLEGAELNSLRAAATTSNKMDTHSAPASRGEHYQAWARKQLQLFSLQPSTPVPSAV